MSILLHTLVCSVIGIDKLYILHLIFSGIMDITVMFSEVFKIENSNYLVYISCIIAIFSYWIFNIRTRILYLYQFRFAVKNTNISKETLFQKLFKWWVLVHLILIPYIILTISISDTVSDYYWNFMCALCVAFELKMYLALTPENESWNYVFSTRTCLVEKFYIFSALFYITAWIIGSMSITVTIKNFLDLTGSVLWSIRWICLYFYAETKLDNFVFKCIDDDDDDSDSKDAASDKFEFGNKPAHLFASISGYEPSSNSLIQ